MLPIIRVAAPVRTSTPGHSTSVSASALSPVPVPVLALEDDLNKSSGDELNTLLVLPQALKASAKPKSAVTPMPVRIMVTLLSRGILNSLRFLYWLLVNNKPSMATPRRPAPG
ncbi:MAG: hypothetical protein WDN48_03950 [Pseudolabrys sp.]